MKSVRIGAGLGFYGDSWRPVRASIESGGVQYIASDHLAELTLAILQKDRQKDPGAGYARDCVPMLAELWPLAAKHGVKFVLNAGGLNPQGAREAIARTFREKGWKARIAIVTGEPAGARCDLAVYSLHARKIVTTGEGGMITTNDSALAERLRRLARPQDDPRQRQRGEEEPELLVPGDGLVHVVGDEADVMDCGRLRGQCFLPFFP